MNEPRTPAGPSDLHQLVHELRQCLGSIMVLAGAARTHAPVSDEVVDVLSRIESEVEAASAICRQIISEN